MFDWITKPLLMWTPIDSLLAIVSFALFIFLINIIVILILTIISYFNNKKGK